MTDEIEEEIQHFKTLLTPILGRFRSSASTSVQRRLIGNYGLCLKELAILWILLKRRGFNVGEHRDRMLWALHWLRSYGTEEQCVTHFRPPPSEKTFRDAVKQFVEYFASLELVRWERRFEDWPFEQPSYSIDGIDCPIWTVDARRRERPDGRGGPNGSGSFVSHKFRHDALRYLVCLHMCLPIIVAAGGGYPAGHYVDLRIAQNDIVPLMGANERGNADGGYQDGFTHFMTPFRVNARARRQIDDLTMAAYHEAHQHVRARQEHINAELKEWKVLRETFRHDPQFHPTVFHAIVQLTQLRLETQPSILVAPLYAAVIHQGNVGILQFNKDGTVANSCQL